MKIKRTRHVVYLIAYHIVWVTKYRRTVLGPDMWEPLKTILREAAQTHGYEILEVEIMPDHVHCFVNAPPQVPPSTIVRHLKGVSARRMFQQFPYLLTRLWGGHLWHPGSYVGTAGKVSADIIKRYIQSQHTKG